MNFVKEGDLWSEIEAIGIYGSLSLAGRRGLIEPQHSGKYKNRFVGWWASPDGTFNISLPKAFPTHPDGSCISLLASALRKYSSVHKYFSESSDSSILVQRADPVSLFHELLEHTERFGWHSDDGWIDSTDLDFANWEETASECIGVQDHGSLVFAETKGSKYVAEIGKLAYLQASVLIEIEKLARPVLESSRLRYDPILNEAYQLLNEAQANQPSVSIIYEYVDSNRDHDRSLAELLLRWFTTSSHTVGLGLSGTNSFAHMWEHMIRECILGCSTIEWVEHAKIASQPIYRDLDESCIEISSPQNPDVFFRSDGDLFLLDAKWYQLNSLPGTPDVIKQLAYQLTSSKPIHFNAFVIPSTDGGVKPIGICNLEIDGIEDNRFPKIGIVSVSVVDVLHAYCSGSYQEIAKMIIGCVRENTLST